MTAISYQLTGVVTNVGISAAISAGRTGPKIDVGGFRIGSMSAAEGSVALVTDTDVDDFVYAGDLSAITYNQLDQDTVIWRIDLEPGIGDFDVGNLGLVTASGALFCKATLPGKSFKYASSPPIVLGNRKFYNIVMRLDNAGNLLNLSIIQSNEASIPETPTELTLPPAVSTPWNIYEVDNHTHLGAPTTALRLNGDWYHAPHHLNPGEALSEFACIPALFSADLSGKLVALVGGILVPADGINSTPKIPVGVAMNTSRVVITGQLPASVFGISTALTPMTRYYADGGANAGKLTTTPNGYPVAIAVSTTDLFFDTSIVFSGVLDASIRNLTGAYLPLAGGTMLGPLKAPAGFSTGYIGIAAATTLTQAESGLFLELGGSSPYTVLLPTISDGTRVRYTGVVINSSTGVTLSTGTGNIYINNEVASEILLTQGTYFDIVCDGSNWLGFVVGPKIYAQTMPLETRDFTTSNSVAQTLPNNTATQYVNFSAGSASFGVMSASQFTVGVDGVYAISGAISVTLNFTGVGNIATSTTIFKNGVAVPNGSTQVGNYGTSPESANCIVSRTLTLAAGDVISVWGFGQSSAPTSATMNSATLSITRLF